MMLPHLFDLLTYDFVCLCLHFECVMLVTRPEFVGYVFAYFRRIIYNYF